MKEQGGKVLSGGKYGSNNGYDHVIVFKDAQGNTNLTMVVDSKQLGQKGIKLDPKLLVVTCRCLVNGIGLFLLN